MTTQDWQRISWSNLHNLKSLHSLSLDFVFIKAACSFWDSQDHVFRFQGQELCPLPEEFAAILAVSFSSTALMALPRLPCNFALQLEQIFHLNPREISAFLASPEQVPIAYLLDLANQRERHSPSWGRFVVLILLSQFLLINEEGNCDCRLLSIVEDMEHGLNPFPTILAETIHGLDRVSTRTSYRMSGSPLLLQVPSFPLNCHLCFSNWRLTSLLSVVASRKARTTGSPFDPFWQV